ncbi:HAD family hydrolase [Clostridium sp. cel8]|jgi:phosphoglycolate phosphatase|uniref:HAD family hydrolase n=1 Tax=Clostridium sp. cel8 TaxID=2663123 RepID=UPI0015F530A3|nr:HAD family hydrolase [Clostridium sp. cel8]MBA5851150.1 HAD family hydrolase [Clostridium sp. cel8]
MLVYRGVIKLKYKNILFDLDGTLTDSKEGIIKSVQYSLKKYGINVKNLDELQKFIGPPLKDSFMTYYNFDESKALCAIDYYREYFKDKGIFENKVYKDVEKMLSALKENGFKIILATSKPTIFAEKIIKHFNLQGYFDNVVGSNLDGSRGKKGQVIKYIMDNYLKGKHGETIMVGDRKHDIIGARENNIDCIAVSYGYGSLNEIKNSMPTYIVDSVMGIYRKIMAK